MDAEICSLFKLVSLHNYSLFGKQQKHNRMTKDIGGEVKVEFTGAFVLV